MTNGSADEPGRDQSVGDYDAARDARCGATFASSRRSAEERTARERMRASFARGDLATWAYDDALCATGDRSRRRCLAGARSVVCVAVAVRDAAQPRRAPLARPRLELRVVAPTITAAMRVAPRAIAARTRRGRRRPP